MQHSLPKQYLLLNNRPVILHTLERLCECPNIEGVFVGISPGDQHWAALERELPAKVLGTFEGGAERANTVLNGLAMLAQRADPSDWVMVHDAARPCVRREDIDKLIEETREYPDGGLLAVAVSDTIKRTDASKVVEETVPRENIWRAVTPQFFPLQKLNDALGQALSKGLVVTDEAAAIEQAGGRPRVVPGHADNIKITLTEDLALAELFLKLQDREHA